MADRGDACYFPRDLGKGSYGGDVHCFQQFLSNKGYLLEEPTGYFGERTATATKRWQVSVHSCARVLFASDSLAVAPPREERGGAPCPVAPLPPYKEMQYKILFAREEAADIFFLTTASRVPVSVLPSHRRRPRETTGLATWTEILTRRVASSTPLSTACRHPGRGE